MNAVNAAIEEEYERDDEGLTDELLEEMANESRLGCCPACGSQLSETFMIHDEWEFRCECGFRGKCE